MFMKLNKYIHRQRLTRYVIRCNVTCDHLLSNTLSSPLWFYFMGCCTSNTNILEPYSLSIAFEPVEENEVF